MPPTITRLPDWPERLAAYLAAHASTPFAWPTHSCAHFAAGAAHAITGQHLLPSEWADAAGAARLLRRLGGLAAAVDAVLPALPAPVWAQRGDVVLVRAPAPKRHAARHWLAVVDAAGWRTLGPAGLVGGPMALAVRAWGVGRG